MSVAHDQQAQTGFCMHKWDTACEAEDESANGMMERTKFRHRGLPQRAGQLSWPRTALRTGARQCCGARDRQADHRHMCKALQAVSHLANSVVAPAWSAKKTTPCGPAAATGDAFPAYGETSWPPGTVKARAPRLRKNSNGSSVEGPSTNSALITAIAEAML